MIPLAIGGTILALMYSSGPQNNVDVKASDGKTYRVQNLPDKQEAANLLSKIKPVTLEGMTNPNELVLTTGSSQISRPPP